MGKRLYWFVWTSVLALALTAAAPRVAAQADTAQLSGFVKDATGATVPGATVTVSNESTGAERSAQTNESGYYVLPALPPAFYSVVVEAEGFKTSVTTNNKLDPNLASQLDISLEVGAVSESIEVRAQSIQLQSETATVGRLVEEKQIKNLTLNGRNPVFLAMLKPGVVRNGSLAGFSFGLTSGGFSINGSRSQDNVISMDGAVNTRTRSNGTSVGVADLETVQEMQILTANYNAEYGRGNAGQIRFVTKSGGQDFHGSFYEYFRNEKLDANSWSRNRGGLDREARKFNQFGYVLSGPVPVPGADTKKLFWLWSQEWVRFREGRTSIQQVPSLGMRNGDFSELLGDNTFFDDPQVVNDPDTGEAFANNIIPQSRLSRNGIGMLSASPLPTPGFLQGSDNFIQTRPQPTDQRKDTVSIDYNPTEKHNFRFRLQNYGLFTPEAFRGGTDRAVRTIDRPNRTYTLNHIWTVSPTWINELLLSVSYDRVFLEVPVTPRLDRSTYGIDYPYVFSEPKEIDIKIPTIVVGGGFVTVDGGPYPASSSGPIYQLSNNVTKIFGNHTVKFGGRFERTGQNDFDQINVSGVPGGTNNQNGRFEFADTRFGAPTSGLAVANAALGLFSRYAEIGPRAYTPYRSMMGEGFVQDSWKATPKLRVEYGIRYSLLTPYYYSTWRNMAVFDANAYDPNNAAVLDPSTGNVLSGDRFNGVVIPGTGFPDAARGRVPVADSGEFDRLFNGGPKYWGEVQKWNFQPRVGLAYRVGDKSVIRTGFGRYMARPGVADNVFLGGNPPFQPMASISAGLADNPGGGDQVGFPQFFMTNDPVYKIPSSIMWNLTFQREVGFDTLFEVGYVGRVGTHLERVRDANQNPAGTMLQQNVIDNNLDANFLRPFKGFANIIQGENAARSEYNGLQMSANRRFADSLSFGVAYTYGKSVDNADGRRDRIYDNYDDTMFWGPSDHDIRQSLVTNFVWELPFFREKGLMRSVLGGWTLSGVVQFQTGRPRTISRNVDYAGIGETSEQPWEVSRDPSLSRSDRGFSQGAGNDDVFFFETNASGETIFSTPAPGTFSRTQRRNQYIRDPGFQNWNMGVFKDFLITERQKVSFRGEFFNLPNHPNRSAVNINPVNSNFGRVTAKNSERNVQLSLRYSF